MKYQYATIVLPTGHQELRRPGQDVLLALEHRVELRQHERQQEDRHAHRQPPMIAG
jgi:hypothetical protein